MRCLTLAVHLQKKGAQCFFVIRSESEEILSIIRSKGFLFYQLRSPNNEEICAPSSGPEHAHWLGVGWKVDAAQMNAALKDLKIDWVIVDHYGLDINWERSLRVNGRLLMVIDDLADRHHDCDLLIDPGVEPDLCEKYQKLTNNDSLRLIGPKYALLRDEFINLKNSQNLKRKFCIPKNIVVMFGGGDSDQSTLESLNIILKVMPVDTKVDVIISLANVNKTAIVNFCNLNRAFTPHVASSEVAAILARADFAIGSGGGATYERVYMGLPALLKVVAKNQLKPLRYMEKIGLISLYETKEELRLELIKVFHEGVNPPPDIVQDGVSVICRLILDKLVQLNVPVPLDVRRTYQWLQNATLRNQFLMSARPLRIGHFNYWRNLISDCEQKVFSIYFKNQHIGNAGIKNINIKKAQSELWLYMGKTIFQGMGLGKVVLTALEKIIHEELCCSKVILHVSKNNTSAYNFYIHNGYAISADQSEISKFNSTDQVVCMEKLL